MSILDILSGLGHVVSADINLHYPNIISIIYVEEFIKTQLISRESTKVIV